MTARGGGSGLVIDDGGGCGFEGIVVEEAEA